MSACGQTYLGTDGAGDLVEPRVELEGLAVADLVLEPEHLEAPGHTVHGLHLAQPVAGRRGRAHRALVVPEGFLRNNARLLFSSVFFEIN